MAGSSTVSNSRLAAYCGIVSLIVVFTLINVAISLYRPGFVWTDRALSDLGVESSSAMVFNSGLVVGGILYFVFALGVMRFFQSQITGRIGAFMLLVAAAFLCLIGVFPETAPDSLHFYVSAGFFVSVLIALLLLAANATKIFTKNAWRIHDIHGDCWSFALDNSASVERHRDSRTNLCDCCCSLVYHYVHYVDARKVDSASHS